MLAATQQLLKRGLPSKWLAGVLFIAGMLGSGLAASPVQAQECHGIANRECHEGGALLHGDNWTTQCGPNSYPSGPDTICGEITQCPAAGSFGKFLKAVTGSCRSKHFRGYFGLDGMTFGILDWTQNNLPSLLQAYQRQNPRSFAETLGGLGLPIHNGCLDARWTCESNRKGQLMCDAGFHGAFEKALGTADFQKAQATVALTAFEERLGRVAPLGLHSEYGNVAMAVVLNNLKTTPECRPATWKAACAGQPDERSLVDCMLDQYVEHKCRGRVDNSKRRRDEIKRVFSSPAGGGIVNTTPDAVIACSANWGK